MNGEIELIIAVSKQAYFDLVTAYRKKDSKVIWECEHYFTDPNSLFSFLNVDGTYLIKKAQEEVKDYDSKS